MATYSHKTPPQKKKPDVRMGPKSGKIQRVEPEAPPKRVKKNMARVV